MKRKRPRQYEQATPPIPSSSANTTNPEKCETGFLGPTMQMNSINATLILDNHYASSNTVRQWGVFIDRHKSNDIISTTTSPQPHTTEETKTRRLTSVNGQSLQIYGIRHVTMIHNNNLAIPTTFVIADVSTAILGLHAITKNDLKLEIEGYSGYLSNDKVQVRLHYIHHVYIKAAMRDHRWILQER
eukprot:5975696-Amphidinium_carterae.1